MAKIKFYRQHGFMEITKENVSDLHTNTLAMERTNIRGMMTIAEKNGDIPKYRYLGEKYRIVVQELRIRDFAPKG